MPTPTPQPDRTEDTQIPFGKYKGRTLGEVLAEDAKYLDWLVGDIGDSPFGRKLKMFCLKYSAEIERAIYR